MSLLHAFIHWGQFLTWVLLKVFPLSIMPETDKTAPEHVWAAVADTAWQTTRNTVAKPCRSWPMIKVVKKLETRPIGRVSEPCLRNRLYLYKHYSLRLKCRILYKLCIGKRGKGTWTPASLPRLHPFIFQLMYQSVWLPQCLPYLNSVYGVILATYKVTFQNYRAIILTLRHVTVISVRHDCRRSPCLRSREVDLYTRGHLTLVSKVHDVNPRWLLCDKGELPILSKLSGITGDRIPPVRES